LTTVYSSDFVKTVIDDGCAAIELCDSATLNSLSPQLLDGVLESVVQAEAAGCRVVTIRGRGAALSAGANLPHLLTLIDDPAQVTDYIASIGSVLDRIESSSMISVCIVDGFALAGGLELLLACDLAISADEAQIGDRHLEYGLLPGAGGSVRLSRAVPSSRARRLLYTGEIVDGRTAEDWGLVAWSVPSADLDPAVADLVERLLRNSGDALVRMKRLHRDAMALGAAEALALEREVLTLHLSTSPDAREGLSAFAEKRSPEFNRHPASHHLIGVPDLSSAAEEPHRAAPVSGRWFEELTVGTVVEHVTRRTVTETDNVLFTTMTMNPAPMHLDADYASRSEFGQPLVNSMFTAALVVGLSVHELTLGTIVAQLGLEEVAFPAPVFVGDTIRVVSEVVESRPSKSRANAGLVVFEHQAFNQRNELVCRLRRTGLMMSRASTPGGAA
jgi:enoyl-CoA hydratase/carnithine racemase/acyl dehydratase